MRRFFRPPGQPTRLRPTPALRRPGLRRPGLRRLLLAVSLMLGGLVGLVGPCGLVGPAGPGGPLTLAGAAQAQEDQTPPDYAAWEKVARRAETALEERRASDSALEQLRRELAGWRDRFSRAQEVNAARIDTLKVQIAALGPPPEDGTSEPAELTSRRAELQAQLAEQEAPRRQAEEAFSRADGLISEIDKIIRARQTRALLQLKASPLNPALWPDAVSALGETLSSVTTETGTALQSDAQKKTLTENLPLTLVYLLLAFVLLLRGRLWMVALTMRVQRAGPAATAGLRGFAVSLGQVILPVIGIYALDEALYFTGLLGFRGQLIADALVPLVLAVTVARWLALRLLPRVRRKRGFLELPEAASLGMRRYAAGLGAVWGINRLLEQLSSFEGYAEDTVIVLQFPLVVLGGFLMFRIGRLLRQNATDDDAGSDWDFRSRSTDILGRALIAFGALGPLASAVGYHSLALATLFPSILSLGLLALIAILSGVARDLYAWLARADDEAARASLVPVLASAALVLASLPVFALIWGARTSDLTELWARFNAGIQIGGSRITPSGFLTFAIVFAAGYAVTRLVQSTLRNSVLPKTRIDPGGQTAIVSGLGYLGIFLAAIIAITAAGLDLSSLAIVAGALSVGIGFGLQNIVSNFVSGIILLIERPIAEGDWIEVGGFSGTVRDISVRSTRIETFDRSDVIIPNSDLISGTVTNYTRGKLIGRIKVPVGVAYGSDTRKVAEILREIAESHPMVMLNPAPAVHFMGFGADSLDFQIRAILRDVNFSLSVKTELNHLIAERFAREGIEIPFAQRDIWLRNPESLRAPPAPPAPGAQGPAAAEDAGDNGAGEKDQGETGAGDTGRGEKGQGEKG